MNLRCVPFLNIGSDIAIHPGLMAVYLLFYYISTYYCAYEVILHYAIHNRAVLKQFAHVPSAAWSNHNFSHGFLFLSFQMLSYFFKVFMCILCNS